MLCPVLFHDATSYDFARTASNLQVEQSTLGGMMPTLENKSWRILLSDGVAELHM